MVVKNNPIAYLENRGYRWTSDPNLYYQSYNPNRGKKPWGKRDHYAYGVNVDSYCGGYHRAYDMVKRHGAGIPAIANATVLAGTGWNTFGWTLVLGFKDAKGRLFQVIYGHLNRNPLLDVKIGQNVKQGQIVAYQGASNNLGVSMASHLHIQFQNYQSYNEWSFTCLGIDPLNIDVSKSSPSSGATPSKKPSKPSTPSKGRGTGGAGNIRYKENNWRYNKATKAYWTPVDATFIVGNQPIYVYDHAPKLTLSNRARSQAQPGALIKVLELARADGHVWIGYRTGGGLFRYMPIKKWNGGGGRVTNKGLWGKFT